MSVTCYALHRSPSPRVAGQGRTIDRRWEPPGPAAFALADVVANPPHALEVCLGGIVDLPVLVALAGIDRARVASEPIVMTASAARTTSSVIDFGNSFDRSTPSSAIAAITFS